MNRQTHSERHPAAYWRIQPDRPAFPSVDRDLEVDAVVIGGGVTGITAALLLKEAGANVILLERRRCASNDTGNTTAHLTYVTDERLHHLVKVFGKDGAKAFWEAGAAAIDHIFNLTRSLSIECDFRWVPGFLHESLSGDVDDRKLLVKDAELAEELGFSAEFLDSIPFVNRPGVKFSHQAKFHPIKYLNALLKRIPGDGSFVFENADVSAVEADPLTVRVGKHKIRCEYVMIATHNPLAGEASLIKATLFQSKLALYTSYVLGAKIPSGLVPEALFWDTATPYYYTRKDVRDDGDYLVFGGEDVKTGQEEKPELIYEKLERRLKSILPAAQIIDRWVGQVVETNDGLPFIGESANQQFIATGFCGNGFTLGTLSAFMARDRYIGRKNPWFDLFAVNRRKFHGGAWRYIKENLDYPYYLLRDRFASAEGDSLDDLKPGQGKVLQLGGKKVAAYRDESGEVILNSPVCTHLKCIVHWNAAGHSWDCPCHGSRFTADGEVLSGPAEAPLERLHIHVEDPHHAEAG